MLRAPHFEQAGAQQDEIVKALKLHKATVAKHLARLEKEGHITVEDAGVIKLIRTR